MRVTIDLMKKSTQIIDLSNVINPRVGDDDLLLPLHIVYSDNQTDMRGKDVEFLSNDPNKKNIYIAGTCNTNTPGDNLLMGNLTFRFPAGTFKADGTYDPDKTMFRIVDKETQKVISSVNVKITVMKNNIEFDFDPDKSSYDSRAETMLQDFHDKGQAMLDEIKSLDGQAKSAVSGDTAATANDAKVQAGINAGEISDLKVEIAGARGRYSDLPDREDAQDTAINQKETIVNANANYAALKQKDAQQDAAIANKADRLELENKLSQMKLNPEGFANFDALKAKYPNGNSNLNVAVDTGHLWIWYDGAWKDCGQYQTAGLDSEVLDKIERLLYKQQQELDDHNNKLNQAAERISDQQSELDEHESDLKLDRTDIQDVRGVGSLKDIELVDDNGNRLVDDSGVGISGQRWLINTDKTLSQADLPADAKAVGEALITKPDTYDIPVLYLYGDGIPSLQSKADSLSDGISYSFPRFNISGSLKKIKVQGASSATLAKKNYTLQFDHSVEIFPEYGKQKKYVIKADMTDFSHVRNTGCAQIWGKVRQTRVKADDAIKLNDTDYLVDNFGNHIVGESDPQLSIGGTFGTVDGFPIAVYINDRYWGLYSFNVPKDAWMAKMSSRSEDEAIVSTDWTALDKTIRLDGTDMEIEFCGTKDTAWVFSSINALIDVLKASYTTKEAFDQEIDKHLDVDSTIDYYVYSAAIGNTDGVLRNYLFQTWNRTKWYIAAYDLDMTFGRTPDLSNWLSPVYNGDSNRRGGTTLTNLAEGNRLFHQLWKFHKEDIITRYKELVAGPLSSGAVSTLLTNFAAPIPDALLSQEDKTWPQTRLSGTNNLGQIRWWYMEHINFLTNSIVNA